MSQCPSKWTGTKQLEMLRHVWQYHWGRAEWVECWSRTRRLCEAEQSWQPDPEDI